MDDEDSHRTLLTVWPRPLCRLGSDGLSEEDRDRRVQGRGAEVVDDHVQFEASPCIICIILPVHTLDLRSLEPRTTRDLMRVEPAHLGELLSGLEPVLRTARREPDDQQPHACIDFCCHCRSPLLPLSASRVGTCATTAQYRRRDQPVAHRHPDTFCLIFAMRMSRSTWLFSNGIRKSVAKRR